jgi:hypothetical protein
MKLRKYGAMGDMAKITNREDNTRTNYDDEWLPPYDELRIELVNSFQLQERRIKDLGKQIRNIQDTLSFLSCLDTNNPALTKEIVLGVECWDT